MAATQQKPSPEDRVCIGAVAGVRGLKGEVRIKSFTADPDDIAAYGPLSTDGGERSFDIRVTARAKGQIIARLSGIDDRDAAEALKGERLYVPKSALPEAGEGAYYHADLIGLGAETAAGEKLGIVKAVHNFGAGDVIEISGKGDKGGLMVPFTAEVVPEVDIENGRIVVSPPAVLETGAGEDENPDEDES
ncbi:MAG: 16S rRNA processing protein RimM [Rhodospirillaceae bacterium]|jgi:16S rRNA processing protein RimM|nr:16S rRNA processing protein RimM [Rhodospirillaceae bacterium]|tara:strand:- start:3933 stop:4505 length:573 start_codon:yes stop_codon:yes gene_type:complete